METTPTVLPDETALKVYIAGPMTGYPEYNIPAFLAAGEQWRKLGWVVENPGEFGEHEGWAWIDYMVRDLPIMMRCHAVALLPGWEESEGAFLENLVREYLGIKVFDANHPVKPPPTHQFYQRISYSGYDECCMLPEYAHFDFWKPQMKNMRKPL